MVRTLIAHAANVNSVNANGGTPLHDAARKGRIGNFMQLLVSFSHIQGDANIIRELIQARADPNLVGLKGAYEGKQAIDLVPAVYGRLLRYAPFEADTPQC